MRKAFGLWTVALLVLWSCELQTITVKAKPTVALPAGTLSVEVGKTLTDAIKEGAGADSPMTVSQDAEGNIALVLDQKILDLPLKDVFDSGAIDLGNLSADIPEQTLEIPAFAGATVTMPYTVNPPAREMAPPISNRVTLAMNAGSGFVGGKIQTGSLNVVPGLPAGTTLVSFKITLSQTEGGVTKQVYTDTSFNPNPSFNLVGVELGSTDITVDYTIEVDIQDPMAFTSSASGSATATLSVSSFQWVKFSAPNLDLSETINTPFSADLKQFLDQVTIKDPAGITVNFTNGLPMDMTFNVSSTILGIASSSLTVPARTGSGPSTTSGNFAATNFVIDVDGGPGFDLTFTVGLSGYDAATKVLTLNNVTPGTTYTYGGKVIVDIVPVEAVIKNLDSTPLKGSFPGLPVDGVSSILPAELAFNSIPFELTISGLPNLSGKLLLTAKYKDAANVDQTITVLNAISGAFSTKADGTANSIISGNMKDVLNLRKEDLATGTAVALDYELQIGGATVPLTSNNWNFAAQLKLSIPFVLDVLDSPAAKVIPGEIAKYVPFKLKDPDPLDFSAPDKDDLFGRKVGVNSELDDVIRGLTEATLNLGSTNTTGLGMALGVSYGSVQKFAVIKDSGVSSLTLNAAELEPWKTVPFKPKMELLVPVGTMKIKATGVLDLNVSLQAKSDVDLDIALKDGAK